MRPDRDILRADPSDVPPPSSTLTKRIREIPILPAESLVYPDDLLADGLPRETAGRVWWVLHTRPRQEKCLARELCAREVPCYLPVIARRHLRRGRAVTSHTPLFASYVFLLATWEERICALGTKRVAHALEVKDQDRMWRDLRQIHHLLASGAPVTPEEKLGPGVKVEIISGSLKGLKGTVVRSASGRRFIVLVDFIQRGASVLLDDYTLTRDEE